MIPPRLPWHAKQWAQLESALAERRLAHALLVGGPEGTGRTAFVERFAAGLLCTTEPPHEQPCGQCASCRQFAAGTHPDLFRIEPTESGKAIGIDAIRGLSERLHLTAGQGAKVGLINPADAMTTSAANSLLKSLEEPPTGTYLLLLTARSGYLPATIKSRSQRLAFGMPTPREAVAWLHDEGIDEPEIWLTQAGGAPLLARDLAQAQEGGDRRSNPIDALIAVLTRRRSPVGAASLLSQAPLDTTIRAWILTTEDILRLKRAPGSTLRLPHRREALAEAAQWVDERALFDYLGALYRSVPDPSSALRAPLQIQGLLVDAAGALHEPEPTR